MPIKTFLIDKVNDNLFRLNGLVPSKRKPRKENLCQSFCDHVLYSADQLPPKVDLRPDMSPVEDQSKIGSCAANCLAGAYEYLTKKKNGGTNVDISRLFIYYNARSKAAHSQTVADTGCSMTNAIESLEEFGTCLETIWPYDITKVNERPSEEAFEEGAKHQITEALQVNLNLDEMKSCLAQGFPFAFGLRLFTSFDKAREGGLVPMPDLSEGVRKSHGSHALLAVGYSDESKAFIIRNSWGENWGDKGYCYIPYDYLTNSSACFDAWTIRRVEGDDVGKEYWQFNDAVDIFRNFRDRFFKDDDDSKIDDIDEDDDNFFERMRDRFGHHFQGFHHHHASGGGGGSHGFGFNFRGGFSGFN